MVALHLVNGLSNKHPSVLKVNTFSIWQHNSKHIHTQTSAFTEEKKKKNLNSQPNVIYYKELTTGAAVWKSGAMCTSVEEMREIGYTGAEEVIRSQAFNEAGYRCGNTPSSCPLPKLPVKITPLNDGELGTKQAQTCSK